MAPIRVGIIGLGASDSETYQPGEWGVQHMKAINHSPNYELVAVANSSVESAEKSIKAHNLPATVKAYGSPEDIARDPNVDLVVVAVSVTKHVYLAKPALQQKKNVLIEFPVGPSSKETEELAKLAKENGVTVLVGSQGRSEPAYRKLKSLVETKAIGDIVYTSLTGHIPITVSFGWPQSQTSFLDLKPGASRITVALGHTIDAFTNVSGQFETLQSVFKIVEKTAKIFGAQGEVVDPAHKVTTPDTILIQGVLDNGAAATLSLRSSVTTADDIGFRWIISGTEGEMIFTGGVGFIQNGIANTKIQLRRWGSEAEDVEFGREEDTGGLTGSPLSVSRLYEAFAAGDLEGFATIDQSLQTETLLEDIVKSAVWAP